MKKNQLHAMIAVETSLFYRRLWKLIDGSDYTGLAHIKGWNYIIGGDTRFIPTRSRHRNNVLIIKNNAKGFPGSQFAFVYSDKQYLIINSQVKIEKNYITNKYYIFGVCFQQNNLFHLKLMNILSNFNSSLQLFWRFHRNNNKNA